MILENTYSQFCLMYVLLMSFLDIFSGCCLVAKSSLTLETPWTIACQVPLSMGFPRQEYWSGLPFPSPGDLLNPGIESGYPALAGGFLITESGMFILMEIVRFHRYVLI